MGTACNPPPAQYAHMRVKMFFGSLHLFTPGTWRAALSISAEGKATLAGAQGKFLEVIPAPLSLTHSTSVNSETVGPSCSPLLTTAPPSPNAHCLLPGSVQQPPHLLSCPTCLLLSLFSTPQPVSISSANRVTPLFCSEASNGWPPTSLRGKIQNLPPALPDSDPCQSRHISWLTVLQPRRPPCCSSHTPSRLEYFRRFKSLLRCPRGFTSEASRPPSMKVQPRPTPGAFDFFYSGLFSSKALISIWHTVHFLVYLFSTSPN